MELLVEVEPDIDFTSEVDAVEALADVLMVDPLVEVVDWLVEVLPEVLPEVELDPITCDF